MGFLYHIIMKKDDQKEQIIRTPLDRNEFESLFTAFTKKSETDDIVWWAVNGKCYHVRNDCGSLRNAANLDSGEVEFAIQLKKKPCSHCCTSYDTIDKKIIAHKNSWLAALPTADKIGWIENRYPDFEWVEELYRAAVNDSDISSSIITYIGRHDFDVNESCFQCMQLYFGVKGKKIAVTYEDCLKVAQKRKKSQIIIRHTKQIIIACAVIGAVLSIIRSDHSNAASMHPAGKKEASEYAQVTSFPVCDGSDVIHNCSYQGKVYRTYIYHRYEPARTHEEHRKTGNQIITGYCTLCVDGTYSPSCATGRGACSYHGGVAQWNAPVYADETYTVTIIDEPEHSAYTEMELAD